MSVATFGTWSFLLSFTFFQGYVGVLDLGFSVSALRAIVHERGGTGGVSPGPSVIAFRAAYRRSSLLGALALLLLLPIFLALAGADLDRTQYLVVVVSFVLLVPIDMLHSSNLICLESCRRYPTIRVLQLFGLYGWILLVWAALSIGAGIAMVSVAFVLQSLIVATASSFSARSFFEGKRVRTPFRSSEVKMMFRIGKWMTLFQFVVILQTQMDRTVIAFALGVDEVASYQIPYKVFAFGFLILQQFPSAIGPVASRIQAGGDVGKSGRLFQIATRWTVFASLPVFVAIFVFARPLITLWVGDQYSDTYWIARLFMVCLCLMAFHYAGVTMLAAHGRTRSLFLLYALAVSVNLIFSLVLVRTLGIAGVVIGTIVGALVSFVPYIVIEVDEFCVQVGEWIRSILIPAIFVLAWTSCGALVVSELFEAARSFLTVGIGVALIAAWGWIGVIMMPKARRESIQILSSLRS